MDFTFELPKGINKLAKVAASKHGRFALAGIRVACDDTGEVTLTVTDGRSLVQVTTQAGPGEIKPGECLIDAKAFAKAAVSVGCNKAREVASLSCNGSARFMGSEGMSVDVGYVDLPYPEMSKVIPAESPEGSPAALVGMNPKYVIPVMDAIASICEAKGVTAQIPANSAPINGEPDGQARSPIRFDARGAESTVKVVGVVMPMASS